MSEEQDVLLYARMLRLATIKNCLKSGLISREDALELLKGPLDPEDETTVVDDSGLLDKTSDELVEMGLLSA